MFFLKKLFIRLNQSITDTCHDRNRQDGSRVFLPLENCRERRGEIGTSPVFLSDLIFSSGQRSYFLGSVLGLWWASEGHTAAHFSVDGFGPHTVKATRHVPERIGS